MTRTPRSPADGTTIVCHPHELPPSIGAELAVRYQTLHASLPFLRVWRCLDGAGCYIARRDGQAAEVFVFTCARGELLVLNEMIEVDPAGLKRFADYVFGHFAGIDVIRFNAVSTSVAGLGRPAQRYNAKETYVIDLPGTPEAYLASLGKSTRANLRARMNQVARAFPSYATTFLYGEDIGDTLVRAIVGFSEERMKSKGVVLRHDVGRIVALSRACGFATVLSVDGRMCAGSINYRIGDSVFGDVTAHDPDYERHGVGALCVHATIGESIRTGARRFYLGGGIFGFKERMLGQRLCMDELHIYRSAAALLARPGRVAATLARARLRRLKQALHERKGTVLADLVFKCFHSYKNKAGK